MNKTTYHFFIQESCSLPQHDQIDGSAEGEKTTEVADYMKSVDHEEVEDNISSSGHTDEKTPKLFFHVVNRSENNKGQQKLTDKQDVQSEISSKGL